MGEPSEQTYDDTSNTNGTMKMQYQYDAETGDQLPMVSPQQPRIRAKKSIAVADRGGAGGYKRSNSMSDRFDDGRASCFVKYFGFNCGRQNANVNHKKSKK